MTKPLPPRKANALRGSQFMTRINTIYGPQYEDAVVREILAGNVPDFVRPENWRKITVKGTVDGMEVEVTFRVCPDYLAIGSNNDYVRVPLSPTGFQKLAARWDVALPTKKVVDKIYAEAAKEGGVFALIDAPEISRETGMKMDKHTRNMVSPEFAWSQSAIADAKIKKRKGKKPGLVVGHKKDVLVHKVPPHCNGNLIQYRPNHPQGLDYGAHPKNHSDYSLGIRLVDTIVEVKIKGEKEVDVPDARYRDVILNPKMYKLLSDVPFDINLVYRKLPTVKMRAPEPKPEPKKRALVH